MFAKLKPTPNYGLPGNASPPTIIDTNPISQYFDIGKQIGSAGPELAWKIFDATGKTDRKVLFSLKFTFFPSEK